LQSASLARGFEYDLGVPVEACAASQRDLVESGWHPLLAALHAAFAHHLPIVLSPDDVWLAIVHGASLHVRENADAVRSRLVEGTGKKTITVRRDDFVKGSPDNDWSGCLAQFSDAIAGFIGKKRDLFVGAFSTTGPVEKAAQEVALMSVMRPFVDFRVVTRCGIPEVTLLGTPEDWESIRVRAGVLAELDLGWWSSALEPVLAQFAAASRGTIDRAFWRSLYKYEEGSGGPWVTGWINALFPFVVCSRAGETRTRRNRLATDWGEVENTSDAPTSWSFPRGLGSVDFVWEYLRSKIAMELVGGFVGVSQDPASLAVRPAIGWAVCEAKLRA
jgi:hypothetical protein